MVVDYRERGRLAKPRNKKHRTVSKPGHLLLVAGGSFIFGLFTGWLVFKGEQAPPPLAVVEEQSASAQEPANLPEQAPQKPTKYTFYDTLPSGSSPPLGSGINRKQPATVDVAAPARVTRPQEATARIESGKRGYTVQASSYQNRADAEQAKSRLANLGQPVYIVESNVAGKGTWFRVRVGKGLDQATANGLATKVGKTAIVVGE
jgi:cell division protein FtsN